MTFRIPKSRKPKLGRCGHKFTPTKAIQPYCPNCEHKFKTGKAEVEDLMSLSRPTLFDMATGAFQAWVREVKYKDAPCYTCGRETKPFHGGHAFPKQTYRGMIFNEKACKKECDFCNVGLDGNLEVFHRKLEQELGTKEWNELKAEAEATKNYMHSREELIDVIKRYGQK